jgi:hypothetical protein
MEKGEGKKEVISLQSVADDAIGGLLTGIGGVAGTTAMIYANQKMNPWIVSALGFGLGIGSRIASNYVSNKKVKEGIKDVANGITAAASVALAVKAVKTFAPDFFNSLPAPVQSAIPQTLNGGEREQVFRIPTLYGASDLLSGDYQEAQVMSSSILS